MVEIRVDMAKYKYVDLGIDDALRLLDELKRLYAGGKGDFDEVARYIVNFDEFYTYMKRRFKDYMPLPHKPEDYMHGRVVIDKVKLYVDDNGVKRIVLVFDRRVRTDDVRSALEKIGYKVNVKKAL